MAAPLFGGEGSIAADYNEKYDRTFLVTLLRMSDKEWVDHFSQLVGLPKSGSRSRGEFKTQWDKTLVGKRALRFLREILPYLYGSKKAEAIRAIEFFSPDGYHKGKHSSVDIWPSSDFPSRKRPLHSEPNKGRPRKSHPDRQDKIYHRPFASSSKVMKMDNRNARRMMDKLGINMKEIPNVQEVVIRTPDKEMHITNASVSEVNAQGQRMFQVAGEVEEVEIEKKAFSDEDILLVQQQTGVTKERAVAALEESDGEVARAILKLTS